MVSSICWVCQWSTAWATSYASSRSCAEACCVRSSSVTSPSPLHRLPPPPLHSTLKSTQLDSPSQVRAHQAFTWPVLLLFHSLLLPFNRAVFTSVSIQLSHNLGVIHETIFLSFWFRKFCNLAIWLHLLSFLLLSNVPFWKCRGGLQCKLSFLSGSERLSASVSGLGFECLNSVGSLFFFLFLFFFSISRSRSLNLSLSLALSLSCSIALSLSRSCLNVVLEL